MNSQASSSPSVTDQPDLSEKEIDAIVTLLEDEDERTDASITAHLLQRSSASRRAVLARAEAAGVWTRMRLSALHRQDEREELAARFANLARDSAQEVDLEEAVFLVARIGMREFSEEQYRAQLDEWADSVHFATRDSWDPSSMLQGLLDVLFKREGFGGDHDSYYQPQNSFLPYVMDHRRGLPITLSVLVLLVGSRAGLPVVGIGAPGHFLLRYGLADTPLYIDAFEGGELLTEQDCLEKIGRADAAPAQVLPTVGPNEIIVRILRNLEGAYDRLDDVEAVADCRICLETFLLSLRSS